ncbi:MAG: Plasmid stabilization system [Candidatus Saccharibacteria bacterium GW2011_GWA2_46_10]|nr:MAG: Plasmid stabilization system [Candidatus Saccharibacteria bacterium GW2011_GWA2_46_10]
MIEVVFTTGFFRQYNKLENDLREEVKEKIELFRKDPHAPMLKAHKLKGKLKGYFSFSVNYRYRVIYEYDSKMTVALLTVGDHDIYH